MEIEIYANNKAKLNSSHWATGQHIDDNALIIASTPAFQKDFNKIKANIAAISSTAQQKSLALIRIAAGKPVSKQTPYRLAVRIRGIIYTYASTNLNNMRKDEINPSITTTLMRNSCNKPT